MKKYLLSLIFLMASCASLFAADEFDYRLRAGISIGGTSPLGLPAEIRKIEGYRPSLIPSIEFNAHYAFNEQWGLVSGLRLEYKGMHTTANVQQWYVTMNVSTGENPGQARGYFTGTVETNSVNGYVTIPVLLSYDLGEKWRFALGGFASINVNKGFTGAAKDGYLYNVSTGRTSVESASYDFSDDVRRFDFGAQLAADWRVWERLAVSAQFAWSITPIFQKGFTNVTYKLYNIYGNIGFAYLF